MTALPSELRSLPLDEKLELLDLLWSDIKSEASYEPPAWHGEVIAEREAKFRAGESKPLNLEKLVSEWRKSRRVGSKSCRRRGKI